MAEIERVCLEKHITQLRFEIHWMYREHVKKWREHFAEKGITVKIKMGVETFDDAFTKRGVRQGDGRRHTAGCCKGGRVRFAFCLA